MLEELRKALEADESQVCEFVMDCIAAFGFLL
jgi:hypothetical protein